MTRTISVNTQRIKGGKVRKKAFLPLEKMQNCGGLILIAAMFICGSVLALTFHMQ